MKVSQPKYRTASSNHDAAAGFTLTELLIAMAVFMIIGGAAFNLVRRHVPLYNTQQNQAGLNMAMRNAATQLQIDAVNAGTGYYTGVNIPSWPVGITINNNPPSTSCFDATTFSYSATCFDSFNIITTDPATPPARPWANATTAADIDTSTMGTIYLKPVTAMTSAQLTAYAGTFKAGDQILFINQDGTRITTTNLIANGQSNGTTVTLQITKTNSDGTVPSPTTTNDPLGITDVDPSDMASLGAQFSSANDFVLKLSTVTYAVDASDPSNPKLTRQVNKNTPDVVAEQIIGFKVGAYYVDSTSTDDTDYEFNRPGMTTKYKWGAIRSVRVSMIGRTPPNPLGNFKNTFDQGPYKIEAISVVVNPRNLSMND